MKNIDLNEWFHKALFLIDKGKNVFITGRAGTGKSTLLEYFCGQTKKKVAVLAPTGVAALNVHGQTIHSFFGFRPDITVSKVRKDYRNRSKNGLYKNLDAIVIDEISMVRADLLDCVDEFLRLNGKNKSMPFGGLQMIFVGDLYQLPPVVKGEEREIFKSVYQTPYFFSSNALEGFDFEIIELEKIYRQRDDAFINILNSVRNRSITDQLLEILNSRFNPSFEPPKGEFYLRLTPFNDKANQINKTELAKFNSKQHAYHGIVRGEFDLKQAPTILDLDVKVGAQVMLVNNDREGRWVNGSVGKIVDIKKDKDGEIICVELSDGDVVNVTPHTWEVFRMVYNQSQNRLDSETVGSFTQYPIILAWAVTIHKSQGKTFDKVIIDMDKGAFAHGQTYVALSRCISLSGIILKQPIKKSHILMDWRVVKFLTGFQYQKAHRETPLKQKIETIRLAIKEKGKLEIVYLKANDEKSKRIISPTSLGEMEYLGRKFLGVEAFDFLRNEERVFRVDRILTLKILSS